MPNVKKFADSVPATMLDDSLGVIIAGKPLAADGSVVVLPAGEVPTFSLDNTALGTLDPSIDPTGLSVKFVGIKGVAGVATVTMSATNPDGSVATGTAVITITLDPAEAGVASFGMSVTPVV